MALLKIFEGVIKSPKFVESPELIQILKANYNKENMEKLLNCQAGLLEHSDGKLDDDIIAISLRIIIDVQVKLAEPPRQVMPPRHMYVQTPTAAISHSHQEERKLFIDQLY